MNGQKNNGFPGQQNPTPNVINTPKVQPVLVAQASSNGSTAKIVGWLAVGVVVGVVLAWGATSVIKKSGDAPVDGALQNAASSSSATTESSDSTLVVATPQKAGRSVAVQKVTVSQPTWVVVYESQDGKPGNVLGAQIFTAGEQSGTVELLRGTIAGRSYFVTERADNGDRRFSLKDDALLELDGQPLWVAFVAD